MSTFSDNLARLRKASGITQAEAGEALHLSPAGYSMYEQGRREPDLDKLRQLASLFSCSVDALLGVQSDALNEYTARLAEIGLTIEYKAGSATIKRADAPAVKLGRIKKTDLEAEIKKALAEYDKDTRKAKAEYITAQLERYAATRRAGAAILSGLEALRKNPGTKAEIAQRIASSLKRTPFFQNAPPAQLEAACKMALDEAEADAESGRKS